jgi:two-component system, OmpR family, phosphate regulon response regulator PhoB
MRTLLIADDESGIRSLVRMTLQRKQYEILEASDGEEALALARKHHPELVLLDVMMPGLTGFEVCRALKDDPATADATVVMLSAKAQDSDRAEGIAAGADDYFTKPFSPIALLRKIDDVYGEE